MHNDRVAGAGVLQQRGQTLAVEGSAGALVREDSLVVDARGGQGIELPFEALLAGGNAGVAEIEPGRRAGCSGHPQIVPEFVSVLAAPSRCGRTG